VTNEVRTTAAAPSKASSADNLSALRATRILDVANARETIIATAVIIMDLCGPTFFANHALQPLASAALLSPASAGRSVAMWCDV
jgi:hypothetical protein